MADGNGTMRTFDTGATRDTDLGKLDYEGFLSPIVVERFAEYMHKNRVQSDGSMRASDNWTKGIPKDAYMKSGFRHFMNWWKSHRGYEADESVEDALCAILFNASGYLHEHIKARIDEAAAVNAKRESTYVNGNGNGEYVER